MGAFLFLSTSNYISGFTVKKIPRRIGIAFFYCIVMIVGMSFTLPAVKQSAILSTLLLAISKLSSSKFKLNLANAYCLIACM
jgi:hypothetical protein